jgi:hypothetical protein
VLEQGQSVRPEHPLELAQCPAVVGHVLQDVAAEDQVEPVGAEWKLRDVHLPADHRRALKITGHVVDVPERREA